MKTSLAVITLFLLATLGCATSKTSDFAPFEAQLEPVRGGGAKHLVLINSSGRELHNFRFSAYVFNEHSLYWVRRHQPYRDYLGSGAALPSGKEIHFRLVGLGTEDSLLEGVTRIEVVGHCDEGKFRQVWRDTEV